jgi:hypothetical protein
MLIRLQTVLVAIELGEVRLFAVFKVDEIKTELEHQRAFMGT